MSIPADERPDFVIWAGAGFLAVDTVLVALRLYTRRTQRTRIGADDGLSIASLVALIGLAACFIAGVRLELLGYASTAPKTEALVKLQYAFLPLQICCVGAAKLSLLWFYRRIFVVGSAFHRTTVVAITIVVLWMVACIGQYLFQCGIHFSADWAPHDESVRLCDNGLQAEVATAISDFLTDLIVFALPIPLIVRLQLTLPRKLLVLLVFALGALAIAASAVRMAVYIRASAIAHTQGTDRDLLITRTLYWAMLEAGLGLMACCLPPLSALVPKRRLSRRHGTSVKLSHPYIDIETKISIKEHRASEWYGHNRSSQEI